MGLLGVVVILAICIFWVCQFIQMMLLSEADFPGKYDKCLWTAAFVIVLLLAPFAFFYWKSANEAMRDSRSGPSQEP